MPSGAEILQADQLNQRITCGAIGQLKGEARPAVTSESHLLRVVPFHGERVRLGRVGGGKEETAERVRGRIRHIGLARPSSAADDAQAHIVLQEVANWTRTPQCPAQLMIVGSFDRIGLVGNLVVVVWFGA